MKRLLNILLFQSAKDLFRYKSFFLLVFGLILADRALRHIVPVNRAGIHLPDLKTLSESASNYIFEQFHIVLIKYLTDYRTFIVLAALFLFKQLISLWPSSDMRRMHRRERGAFGLLGALLTIRKGQILWDAAAVAIICLLAGLWSLACFTITRRLWQIYPSPACLLVLGALLAIWMPLAMAGFSYSSKLAIISQGSYMEKFGLFLHLFEDWRLLWPSWCFFAVRIALEALFVITLPTLLLLTVKLYPLRILSAALLATPVYSYLKMASFKFFLWVYGGHELVFEEYQAYYNDPQLGFVPMG